MKKEMPRTIKEVGFDFSWDEKKVWRIKVPTESMSIQELEWHLDVPFLWSKPDGYYDVEPRWVLNDAGKYRNEYDRILSADTSFPIDVMWWRGRWVILDGLHRLMKLSMQGEKKVKVRKIPETSIKEIKK